MRSLPQMDEVDTKRKWRLGTDHDEPRSSYRYVRAGESLGGGMLLTENEDYVVVPAKVTSSMISGITRNDISKDNYFWMLTMSKDQINVKVGGIWQENGL